MGNNAKAHKAEARKDASDGTSAKAGNGAKAGHGADSRNGTKASKVPGLATVLVPATVSPYLILSKDYLVSFEQLYIYYYIIISVLDSNSYK